MRWPRGKYNGSRIVGFDIHIRLDITEWYWKPIIGHYCGAFHWLCIRSWWTGSYES